VLGGSDSRDPGGDPSPRHLAYRRALIAWRPLIDPATRYGSAPAQGDGRHEEPVITTEASIETHCDWPQCGFDLVGWQ